MAFLDSIKASFVTSPCSFSLPASEMLTWSSSSNSQGFAGEVIHVFSAENPNQVDLSLSVPKGQEELPAWPLG